MTLLHLSIDTCFVFASLEYYRGQPCYSISAAFALSSIARSMLAKVNLNYLDRQLAMSCQQARCLPFASGS